MALRQFEEIKKLIPLQNGHSRELPSAQRPKLFDDRQILGLTDERLDSLERAGKDPLSAALNFRPNDDLIALPCLKIVGRKNEMEPDAGPGSRHVKPRSARHRCRGLRRGW